MKRDDVIFLNQLVDSLDRTVDKMEEMYNKGEVEEFNRLKKFVTQVQDKIMEASE